MERTYPDGQNIPLQRDTDNLMLSFEARLARFRMFLLTLLADLLGFTLAGSLLFLANLWLRLFIFQWGDFRYLVIFLVCLAAFFASRLYPGIGLNPADEIRLVCLTLTASFFGSLFAIGLIELKWHPNLWAFLPMWFFSMVFILLARWSIRTLAVQMNQWGERVVIFSRRSNLGWLIRHFNDRRRLGFFPTLAITNERGSHPEVEGIPVLDLIQYLNAPPPEAQGIETILIDASFFGTDPRHNLYAKIAARFPRVIFVSDMSWLGGAFLNINDLEGMTGIAAHKRLLTPFHALLKRGMDLLGSTVGLLLFAPFTPLLFLAIKLDSPGPVFYTQPRLGKNGKTIQIYKLRTMVLNADQSLEDHLKDNPAAREEWDQHQKLTHDPRITRIGYFLRKFSIDEMPQMFNIFLGEMSLVGPRPIMTNQVALYGEHLEAYQSVRPGLTGLWQVSGRSGTTFKERARFDLYYVRHWSIWLDIYIVLRTVWVVLKKDGAY
jgi:Undecaprenyl-phosphate galactose phosphotransferase WbaP